MDQTLKHDPYLNNKHNNFNLYLFQSDDMLEMRYVYKRLIWQYINEAML